eukprot:10679331-Alexandrium_andersonii.AAC.1
MSLHTASRTASAVSCVCGRARNCTRRMLRRGATSRNSARHAPYVALVVAVHVCPVQMGPADTQRSVLQKAPVAASPT